MLVQLNWRRLSPRGGGLVCVFRPKRGKQKHPTTPGLRVMSGPRCLFCASGIKGRHCWNEKQMLVRNSPDCSSFVFFFKPQLRTRPPSVALPPTSFLFPSLSYSHFHCSSLVSNFTTSLDLRRSWICVAAKPPPPASGASPGGEERERGTFS